jgi:hypothetical protein
VDFDSGRGVFWEGSLINSYLYTGKDNDRFIPILLDDETEDSVPQVMAGWTRYRIRAFVSADTQSVPAKVEIEGLKMYHLFGAKTAPVDRPRAVGLGHGQRPQSESSRSDPQFT